MASAYIEIAALRFPPTCPHCGRPAEASRSIAAMRSRDIVVEYVPPPIIDVPVCLAAARRRRRGGIILVIASLALIIGSGFLAMLLVFEQAWTTAGFLAAYVVVLILASRSGWDDALLDRWLLGVGARRDGRSRVRLDFRRDRYFSEWAAVNPAASMTGAPTAWRPAREAPADMPMVFERKTPAIAFVALAVVIALHHWNASTGGEVFIVGSSLTMMFAFLAAGGVIYPPVFWSIGAFGKRSSVFVKMIGAALAIAGLMAGFLLGISYTHR